jgi:putative transposase
MRKSYKYRLYPTKKQVKSLQLSLDACRWVYNKTLEIRKTTWMEQQKSMSLYDTSNLLIQWKVENFTLTNAHSQCLQNAQARVDLAFKAFFRRVKAKETPGYPRFKGFDRYDSFTFPQGGFKLVNDILKLSKIGSVKVRKHRQMEGIVKTLSIRKTNDKWYACFSCEIMKPEPLPTIDTVVGIDMGLESFATFSNGEKISNPRFFKTEAVELAKAQRKLSKQIKGTPKRKKAKKVVSRIHERISNKRSDFAHKLSRQIVNNYQTICFEKLNIQSMIDKHTKVFGNKLNKSIADVAWNQFIQFTTYKAEEAGRKVIYVNPYNTSKMCSQCGKLVEKELHDRVHSCSCGLVIDRDYNAALNILRIGMDSLSL